MRSSSVFEKRCNSKIDYITLKNLKNLQILRRTLVLFLTWIMICEL